MSVSDQSRVGQVLPTDERHLHTRGKRLWLILLSLILLLPFPPLFENRDEKIPSLKIKCKCQMSLESTENQKILHMFTSPRKERKGKREMEKKKHKNNSCQSDDPLESRRIFPSLFVRNAWLLDSITSSSGGFLFLVPSLVLFPFISAAVTAITTLLLLFLLLFWTGSCERPLQRRVFGKL